jgi:outer membrane protein TolC
MNIVQFIYTVQHKARCLLTLLSLIAFSDALAQNGDSSTNTSQSSAQAQPVYITEYTVHDYVLIGIEHNRSLLSAKLNRETAASELRSSRGRFLPEVTFDATYTLADGGRTIEFPIGDLLNPVYGSLNSLTGSQQFPTDLQNVNQQLLPDNYHETRLRVIQPLFNSDLYFSYRARRDLVTAEDARIQAVTDELTKDIKLSYIAYFAAKDQITIWESNRVLILELIRTTESMVNNGASTIDQLYAARFELTEVESNLASAHRQVQTARAYFNLLLNRDLHTSIHRDSLFLKSRSKYWSAEELQRNSITNRAEFGQLSASSAAARNNLAMSRATILPDVFVVGDLGFQGTNYTFNSEQEYWMVQFGLRWSLFRGFQNREKIARAQIQVRQLDNQFADLLQNIQLLVDDAWQGWMEAKVKEQSAQDGLYAAESAFRIVKRRYEEGNALMVEYLRAQDNYIRAQLNTSLASYQLKSAEVVVERESGL